MICSYSKEFSAVGFTDVENVFIYEYLPVSDGNAVKVYLYGLFLCNNKDFDCPVEKFAETLKMSVDEIVDCFKYWEEFGLVNILSKSPLTVQYLPVRSVYGGKPRKFKAEKYSEFSKSLQALIPNRMISTGEYTEYYSIMESYGIKPEAMIMIVKYCVDRKGKDISYRYVSKVAKDFGARGIVTMEKVENELSSYVLRTSEIEKILKALSLKRQPEIEDLNLFKKWTQELHFEVDSIVFAASALKKGSVNKLDEFLTELYSIKRFTKEEITSYMQEKKKIYELAIRINKALCIYMDVIDTVIDTYTSKWLSYGFSDQTLLYVASYCFKNGKNTLQYMDELLETLRGRGFIDFSSVGDYFESLKRTDEFIVKLLATAGVNRRPNPWDRENLSTWKSWNFSEDMILEAAKSAAGKNSPIAYMNAILSNWKNNGVFTVNAVPEHANGTSHSQEEYNREYEKRRRAALSKAQSNLEKAMSLDGFGEIYSKLNSIEKDLAFAELSSNTETLERLEKEKAELNVKLKNILATAGMTSDDLTPKYRCEKCQDTGYIGTKRCDCFSRTE